MKALSCREYKRLEITEMPEPQNGPDDLLVRVKICGICGSDIHGFDGSTGRRVPPLVTGHKASGIVAEIGDIVARFCKRQRVTFWVPSKSEADQAESRRLPAAGVSMVWRIHSMFLPYDVLLLNYNDARHISGPWWVDRARQAMLDFVRNGKGLVSYHASNNAFRGWQELDEPIGGTWRNGAGHAHLQTYTVKARSPHQASGFLLDYPGS